MSIAAKYRPPYAYDDYCQREASRQLIEGMPPNRRPVYVNPSTYLFTLPNNYTAEADLLNIWD